MNTVPVIAKAICRSWRFDTGEGTCAAICMEHLGSARAKCSHTMDVHGRMAEAIAKALTEAE